jgi:uncharacterized membrane protein required for colicin V production
MLDIVLVGFIALTIFGGFRTGFLRSLLGLLFMAVGLVVGAYLRYPVGALASSFIKDVPADYANLVGYAIVFPVIVGGLHVVSALFLRHVAMQGISRGLDGTFGAIFGGVQAVLILSAAIVIVDTYLGTDSALRHTVGPGALKSIHDAMKDSTTVHILRDTTVPVVLTILGPLLPKDVSSLLPGGLPSLPGGLPGSPTPKP